MGEIDQEINEENMEKSAILSADRKYRYVLSRIWDETKPSYSMIYFSKTPPPYPNLDRDFHYLKFE